jgi:hypothetical protein
MSTTITLNRRKIVAIALLSIGNLLWYKRGEVVASLINGLERLGGGRN